MDRQIEGSMADLEEDGLLESTIIFFLSDHGDCLPRAKRWIYDSGIQIPLIIHVPEAYRRKGMNAGGSHDDRLVSGVDLAPTVLDLAGIDIPDWMQGQSLFGHDERTYVFAGRDRIDNRYDTRRAVRDKRYKYIKNFLPRVPYSQYTTFLHQMPLMAEITRLNQAGVLTPLQSYWLDDPKPPEEFYDTAADPYEIDNLAADPVYAGELERFRTALTEWQTRYGDYGTMDEVDQAEAMWPGGAQPLTQVPIVTVSDEMITLYSPTPGASIAYRTTATGRWEPYTTPFTVPTPDNLLVRAVRYGYKESEEVQWDPKQNDK